MLSPELRNSPMDVSPSGPCSADSLSRFPINVEKDMQTDYPKLRLPKRFEALEREAKNTGADISQIVQRIDSATARIETLVRQVRDGGLGRFELFLGKSGSGKTTFFKTLGHFFEGID